jgi:hypothetical protein
VLSANTPSPLERQGDFSQCDPSSASFNAVVASGCVLPTVNGAKVDTVPVNPNGAALLNSLVPLPNNGLIGYLTAPTFPPIGERTPSGLMKTSARKPGSSVVMPKTLGRPR